MPMIKSWRLISLLFLAQFLVACESKLEQTQATITQQISVAEQSIQQLGSELDSGQIRNAKVLREYSRLLAQQKPEMATLANLIAEDAGTQGPLYQSLRTRINDIKNRVVSLDNATDITDDLTRIKEASRSSLFADALTDPINVLADMSDGKLPRIGAISKAAENSAGGEDMGAGSQLVGNPNYGGWQTQSNGTSFWQWYGMYRLLGDFTDRMSYSRWSNNRRYSYYSDYGRSRYTSPSQYNKQKAVETKTRKSFSRKGQNFSSPYAKKRTGSSGLSRSSFTPTKTVSSYARSSATSNGSKSSTVAKSSSTKSSSSSSFRNSSSRTSRGVSRGK